MTQTFRTSLALAASLVFAACGDGGRAAPRPDHAPELAAVRIVPGEARAGDRLTCEWDGFSDPDGDEDRSLVQWFVNGTSVGAGKTWWGELRHRDIVRCTVTPSDGTLEGAPVSAELVIANSPPSLGYASVAPLGSTADDELTCLTGGALDRDGEPVAVEVVWSVDGSEAGRGPTLAGGFRGGQRVECRATPHDGTDFGQPVTATLTVGNTPPRAAAALIEPQAPRFGDTLRCEASGLVDPDGDPVTVRYVWRVQGNTVGTGPELEGTYGHGTQLTCLAIPVDATDEGLPASASVTFANTPPVIDSLIVPDEVDASNYTVPCIAQTRDVDGDAVSVTFAWTRNGQPAVGAGTYYLDELVRGDQLACTATPRDGIDTGATVTATIPVVNAAPVVRSTQLSPSSPTAADVVTCSYTAEDPDGDPVTASYRWLINGVEVPAGATLSGGFKRGDQIFCQVVVSDGERSSNPELRAVTVRNAAPSLAAVEIQPSPAHPDTPLTCAGVGALDPDGDPITVSFGWYVNGLPAGAGPTLASGYAAGDLVRCEATPSDDVGAGERSSASIVVVDRKP